MTFTKAEIRYSSEWIFFCTGISPFDRAIFSDIDFVLASITEVSDQKTDQVQQLLSLLSSNSANQNKKSSNPNDIVSNVLKDLSPLPNALLKRIYTQKKGAKKWKKILTSSPYRNKLQVKFQILNHTNESRDANKNSKKKKKIKKTKVKKNKKNSKKTKHQIKKR